MATDPIAAAPVLPTAPARPVRWYNLLAYGSNDVLGAGSMAVISTWILIFYTSFCGLSAAQATIISRWQSSHRGAMATNCGRSRSSIAR